MSNNEKVSQVSAGFPSPADNYVEEKLNLNKHLIKNKESTFFVRVSGDSMINVGIFNNDILIVDRSLTPVIHSIVIASIDGELVVKKLVRNKVGKDFYAGKTTLPLIACIKSPSFIPYLSAGPSS